MYNPRRKNIGVFRSSTKPPVTPPEPRDSRRCQIDTRLPLQGVMSESWVLNSDCNKQMLQLGIGNIGSFTRSNVVPFWVVHYSN